MMGIAVRGIVADAVPNGDRATGAQVDVLTRRGHRAAIAAGGWSRHPIRWHPPAIHLGTVPPDFVLASVRTSHPRERCSPHLPQHEQNHQGK